MRVEYDDATMKPALRAIKLGVFGGWIGIVAGAIASLPFAAITAVIIQLAVDDRRDTDEILSAFAVMGWMAFGALCGGIGGPIIAVKTMDRGDDSDHADDSDS